jgi:hypothetical protein
MELIYILVSLVWLSWLCSILIVAHCDFMKTKTVHDIFAEYGDDDTMNRSATRVSYGLFSHPFLDDDETFLGCIRYSSTSDAVDTDRDTKLHVGQTFSIFTILLLTVCCVLSTTSIVFGYKSQMSWRMAHRISICATVTQMLTFFALGSDRCTMIGGCTISRNGKVAILNTVLLAGISLSWFYVAPPTTVFLKLLQQRTSDIRDPSAKADPSRASNPHQQQGTDTHGNDWIVETIDETESVLSENLPPSRSESNNGTESNQFYTNIQDNLYVRLTTIVVMIIAWTVSVVGIQRCTLVLVGYNEENDTGASGLGLFSLAIQEYNDNANRFLGCVAYPDHAVDSLDGPFRTARAFGVLTAITTTSMLLLGLVPLVLCGGILKIWMALRVVVSLSIVTQPLAFVVFRSDVCSLEGQVDCRLGGTGKVVVCNILLFVSLAVFLFVVPPPSGPVFAIVYSDELDDNCETKTVAPVSCDKSTNAFAPNRIHPLEETMKPSSVESLGDHWSSFSKAHRSSPIMPLSHPRSLSSPMVVQKKVNVGLDDNSPDEIASITIQVEYTNTEKKTRKVTKYKDGSQTIATTIEELADMILDDDDYYDDDDHTQVLE